MNCLRQPQRMSDLVTAVNSPEEITLAARRLRQVAIERTVTPREVLAVFERWSAALQTVGADEVPGIAFLRLWLRRGTLEGLFVRELGSEALEGGWRMDGRARLRPFPLGVVGHWPAGNVEIQPVLSLTCALLGGNACVVRVPAALVEITRRLVAKLADVEGGGQLTERLFLAAFDHSRQDLHEALAQAVDGAMIWGGAEAVSRVRALPFPQWARLSVFGPRLSVAAMDTGAWCNGRDRRAWCQRMARDVWQFDQQACTSPQALFLERCAGGDVWSFVEDLKRAFEEEERLHPRSHIEPALTSAICLARAAWLLGAPGRRAVFAESPAWSILVGQGPDLPHPTQGRTLAVLEVDDLTDPIRRFDGTVQTLGLAIEDRQKEEAIARAAAGRGVDRIVKLGRMHVFSSPWDGMDLFRPFVRLVRHVPSLD